MKFQRPQQASLLVLVPVLILAPALIGAWHYAKLCKGAAVVIQSSGARQSTGTSAWHRNASLALQDWRSSLLRRCAELYTAREAAEYQSEEGSTKPIRRVEPEDFDRFQLFLPIVRCPDGELPQRKGASGDGGKWLCMGSLKRSDGGCLVYSIGSNEQFDFEEEMLQEGCTVHTFDCTSKPKTLVEGRHVYHSVCLGNKNEVRKGNQEFQTLDQVLKQNQHTSVDLLKMDIEGFEYEVFSGWKWTTSCHFPDQISVEIHWNSLYGFTPFHKDRNSWEHMVWPMHELSLAELVVVFAHLAELGYGIVSREDNPDAKNFRGCCSEFTFIRVEHPAHCKA